MTPPAPSWSAPPRNAPVRLSDGWSPSTHWTRESADSTTRRSQDCLPPQNRPRLHFAERTRKIIRAQSWTRLRTLPDRSLRGCDRGRSRPGETGGSRGWSVHTSVTWNAVLPRCVWIVSSAFAGLLGFLRPVMTRIEDFRVFRNVIGKEKRAFARRSSPADAAVRGTGP